MEIQDDLTIEGPGADLLTIDASGNDTDPDTTPLDTNLFDDFTGSRVFFIEADATLRGLTLTGADLNGAGGAIYSEGNDLELEGMKIIDNYAWDFSGGGFLGGGGAFIAGGSSNTITITDTLFANNVGGRQVGGVGTGGGLYLRMQGGAEVTISDSQFLNNTSGDKGGGIYLLNGVITGTTASPGDFILQDSVVSGNHSDFEINNSIGRRDEGNGGGMFARLRFSDGAYGLIQVVRSTVEHNYASQSGGGLYFDIDDVVQTPSDPATIFTGVEIRDSTIHNNVAYGATLDPNNSVPKYGGGGLRIESYGLVETSIVNSTISGNRATNGGGLLVSNRYNDEGVAYRPSKISLRHSTITGNKAGPFGTNEGVNVPPFSKDDQVTVGGGLAIALSDFVGSDQFDKPHSDDDPTFRFDHTIIAGNLHETREGDPNYGSLNCSPDIGSDLFPSEIINPEIPVALNEEDDFYHYYTIEAEYSIIGELGPHFYYNVLNLNYDEQESIVGGTSSTDPAANPLLGPLMNNGSPELPGGYALLTHLPISESGNFSPAIDAGDENISSPPATDERGFDRIVDGDGDMDAVIDIGAIEVQGEPMDPDCNLLGDYNRNGEVDATDYSVWRDTLTAGGIYLPNDATPGVVDEEDFLYWRDHYGEMCPTAGQGAQALAVTVADYNADGMVDLDDYDIWFENFGSTTELDADGNGNGIIDLADLAVWQDYKGVTTLDEDIVGDFNLDGVVDSADHQIYLDTYGSTTDLRADADDDGEVEEDDLALLLANFGTTSAAVLPYIRNATGNLPLEIIGQAPNVVGVSLGGSGSTHPDFDFGGVVGSGEQLRSVPVGGLDTIHITFSEEVLVTLNALSLVGMQSQTIPSVSDFSYDLATQTASWVFDEVLEKGQYLIALSDTVVDLDLESLDGEFTNPWSLSDSLGASDALPSGDGEAGGDFHFRFTNLPSDFNNNNQTDGADYSDWADHNEITTGALQGDGDADGDGDVDDDDYGIWLSQFGTNYTNWPSIELNTILVSTLTDEDDANYSLGDLSLREALDLAAGNPGVDRIEFAPGLWGGTIELLSGQQLVIDSDVEIFGPGADLLSVEADGTNRVMLFDDGVVATVSGLTITGGGGVTHGGAVYVYTDLTLDSVSITDSQASTEGGGIYVRSGGKLNLSHSTVDGNQSGGGGGGIMSRAVGNDRLSIYGSTISNNTSVGPGGGLDFFPHTTGATGLIVNSTFSGNQGSVGGGIYARYSNGNTSLTIINGTITDNYATSQGGGIYLNTNASVVMHNTIVAENDNSSSNAYDDVRAINGASVDSSSSHNLIGVQGESGLSDGVNGNHVGSTGTPLAAGLTSLADQGGPTRTHALLEGSAAIDAGNNAAAGAWLLWNDQRGEERYADGDDDEDAFVDIGAFELAADEFFGSV